MDRSGARGDESQSEAASARHPARRLAPALDVMRNHADGAVVRALAGLEGGFAAKPETRGNRRLGVPANEARSEAAASWLKAWWNCWPRDGQMERQIATRGWLDAQLALQRFHDPQLQREWLRRLDPAGAELLALLEPLRCQRLAMSLGAGIAINLLELWAELLAQTPSRLRVRLGALVLALLPLRLQARLLLDPRAKLEPRAAEQALVFATLAEVMCEQAAFASRLHEFLEKSLGGLPFQPARGGCGSPNQLDLDKEAKTDETDRDRSGTTGSIQSSSNVSAETTPDPMARKGDGQEGVEGERRERRAPRYELERGTRLAAELAWSPDYKIFWRGGDRVVRPEDLVPPDRMDALWRAERLPAERDICARHAAKLRRQLLGLDLRRVEADQDEGWPDPNALARLITSPGADKVFRREYESPHPRIAFTLLLDCSGSMKGRPMRIAAHCADLLIRVLERAGLGVELLGYTTGSRGDGPSLARWREAGEPEAAGRVNEVLHLLFKSEYEPWLHARHRLGALFEPTWLKENLDGEALAWAAARLLQRREPRKILLVVSDGAPLDRNTGRANPGGYLESHLRHVIDELSQLPLQLAAIGLNYNIHRYYPQAVRIHRLDDLERTLFEWVEQLLREAKPIK